MNRCCAPLPAITLAMALGLAVTAPAAHAQTVGKITGVGGVFFKSRDPKALMAWYRDVLGVPLERWGGVALRYDAPNHPPAVIVNAFDSRTDYMAPSTREFMLDFAVDDLDACLARLKKAGVVVLKRDDSDPTGRFAWILDPDGAKIELWQPLAPK